jgi:hypothetical protein
MPLRFSGELVVLEAGFVSLIHRAEGFNLEVADAN